MVIPHLNIFCLRMIDRISNEVDCALSIAIQNRSRKVVWPLPEKVAHSCCSQLASFAASDATMYAAFVVESSIDFWRFYLHEIALPP